MNARQYALDVLNRVMNEHGYASLIMRSMPGYFNDKDKALISELVYGTLRNRTLLEYQWKEYVEKQTSVRTENLLNMSAYQLYFLDRIPDYAVLNEAAALAAPKDRKFVNAVLRKMIAAGTKELKYSTDSDVLVRTSVNFSIPLWILKLWKAHYGEETALQLAESNQERPVVYGRINTLRTDRTDLDPERFRFVNEVSFLYDGVLSDTEEFKEGKVLIQDRSSALIPSWMALEPGMSVLDVCAAPGTKTQQMAMYMDNQGHITACDLYEHRLALVEELMKRTGTKIVETMVRDGTLSTGFAPEQFDRILIDAPCSGLGDLRHKPEIRWNLRPEDIDELCSVQSALLANNAAWLKTGGKLIYSTCTLDRKENETMTHRFLQEHPEMELEEERTIFPFEENSDGFYVCRMIKKGVC